MAFRGSDTPTVGAEVEWQLLDAGSLDLVNGIMPLLELVCDNPYMAPEYIQYSVEIRSPVCHGVAELERHMREQTATLHTACKRLGMALAGAGTHPFCRRLGVVTPLPRYRRVEQETGYAGSSQIAFAVHVHVGVPSGPEAIRVMGRLRPYLAVLMALSANSPFWQACDTGFAAYRHRVLTTAHTYGTPPEIPSWPVFQHMTEVAKRAGIFEDYADMHWDLRPRPDLGTLEIRCMDAQPTVHRAAALAAVVRALVVHLLDIGDAPALLAPQPLWLEMENHYRASHLGLADDYVLNAEGHTRPMHDVARQVLEEALPVAERLGEGAYVHELLDTLEEGAPTDWQRRRFAETESLQEVVAAQVMALDREVQAAEAANAQA